MNTVIKKDYEELSCYVADIVIDTIRTKKDAVLCFAAGDTPKGVFRLLKEKAKKKAVDFCDVTFVGLDEWMGLGAEDEGSCHHLLYQELFIPLDIRDDQILFFDAKAKDMDKELRRVTDVLEKRSIDLAVLGLGMNGHIGFNEPGTAFWQKAHIHILDKTTREVGKKYFHGIMNCTAGVTLGFYELLHANRVILMASGTHKHAIVQAVMEHENDIRIPATGLKKHNKLIFALDNAAAKG